MSNPNAGVKVIGKVCADFDEAAKLGTTAMLWEKLFKQPVMVERRGLPAKNANHLPFSVLPYGEVYLHCVLGHQL